MDYSKMSDHEINYAVGLMNQVRNGYYITPRDYCNSWADAGPIIAANKISIDFDADGYEPPQNAWCKTSSPCGQVYYGGEREPLRAAMIVYLMMHDKGEE
ncbi:phage protein NinX family protein [Mixta calida]|uniref:phage protein NinX family protein n=1 Tax=Mixta calida TaxID=665913 RepID=UPI00289E0EF6|nr:phage protein NinX family protein [Mixta calida]MDU5828148.1 phage protein NinX family protein [Mixta calida]